MPLEPISKRYFGLPITSIMNIPMVVTRTYSDLISDDNTDWTCHGYYSGTGLENYGKIKSSIPIKYLKKGETMTYLQVFKLFILYGFAYNKDDIPIFSERKSFIISMIHMFFVWVPALFIGNIVLKNTYTVLLLGLLFNVAFSALASLIIVILRKKQ